MKKPSATALLISAMTFALAAQADEAWHSKPSSEWSDKDVHQILERSPWAHRVSVLLVRPDGEAKPCMGSKGPCVREDTFHSPDPTHPDPAPIKTSSGVISGGRQADLKQDYPGATEMDQPGRSDGVAGVSVVRWVSARTVRDALARLVPPSGKRMEAQELSQLSPVDAYVLYVDLRVGLADVRHVPQNGVLTEQMVRRSTLVLKSSGIRIPAVRVTTAPLPEFDDHKELALAAFYIFFPKLKDGHAVLPPGETDVRFECPLAPVAVRAEFKLSRMEREGSPDF
jgi:hypothetical protein